MIMTLEEKNKLLQDNYEKLILQYNILDRNYKDLCKTQEPVAWMKSALDNARDVCKYLDHDMVDKAKAHTKFFWSDIEKIKEPETHPATWQSLSDDEIEDIWNRNWDVGYKACAHAIEQALKEKNHGKSDKSV